jgi:two-component system C4-dicarboxylate transport sensor histidine kinase DctB
MSQRNDDQDGRISWTKRLLLFGFAIAAIAGSVMASQAIWRENGLRALQAINEQRVQLFANALRSEINRQDHLPIFLSLDTDVQGALQHPADSARWHGLNSKLARLSLEADTSALYVLDENGIVRASSDFDKPRSLLARSLGDEPYFRQALTNNRSVYLGAEPGSRDVRYYIAEAIRADRPIGVAMVRIDFDQLESNWGLAGERVFVTDKNDVVFLSSDPIYKSRVLRSPGRLDVGPAELQGASSAEPIGFEVIERRPAGSVIQMDQETDGSRFLYQTLSLPEYGWTIHRLSSLEAIDADQRDGGIIGGTLSAMLIVMLLYWLQRHRAYVYERESGNRLKAEVERRTSELRETNVSLEAEIEERRRTENKLLMTQNELVQAGKLAALGQMSAAIAHEINQPLAAIRTFIASTRIFAERGDISQVSGNLEIINNLANRMASVTSHLKTFARKSDPGRPDPVVIEQAIDGALFLVDSQIKASGARIEKTIEAPDLQVTGYLVQLEQVMVNLVSNALDAVADVKDPWVGIRVWSSAGRAYISVADNGPGIPPDLISRIFDPFVTTKPVGRGLGLGLSISYGIVQDFNGHIRAANRPEGGAELTIDLPVRVTKAVSPVNAHV